MNRNSKSPRKVVAASSPAAGRHRLKRLCSALPELLEPRTLMSAYLVTTAADLGTPVTPGSYQYGQTLSLRQAIALVNADAPGSSDVIQFNFSSPTQLTISTPLPAITNTVVIDGTPPGQTNYTGAPVVWLAATGGSSAAQGNGLTLTANNSGVNELAITGFSAGAGVELLRANDFVSHDYLGLDPTGGTFQMNLNGLEANNYGVSADGVDASITDSVLSNDEYGVQITADGATVTGNFIGTDPTGTQGRGNAQVGINVLGAGGVTIGGADPSLRNIVSGNFSDGIDFINPGAGDLVIGNYIGLDVTGTSAVPIEYNLPGNGGDGIYITGTSSGAGVVVGGTMAGDANVISSNMAEGLAINSGSGNLVEGNLIGTDASGLNAVPNGNNGIDVEGESSDNVIGGPGAAGNLVSGNYLDGIYFFTDATTSGNVIAGNAIGVNLNGQALPNSSDGVEVYDDVTIGLAGAGNIISGNSGDGIDLDGSGNVVEFNAIGSLGSGPNALAMGNTLNGITVYGGHNIIGANGSGNTIAFNGHAGVAVGFGTTSATASNNDIEGNFIFSNGGLGIDLGSNGVTANDSAGHSGPNALQDFPVLCNLSATAGAITITGTLANAATGSQYTIDLYNNSAADLTGHGQGQNFIGSELVTIGAGGAFTATFSVGAMPSGTVWSATATDAAGNTSEFSADLNATAAVQKQDPTIGLTSSLNLATFGDSVTFTATVSGSAGSPTGTLSLYDGSTLLSSLTFSAGSPSTLLFTTSTLSVASHSICVVYCGDGNYNPGSASLTENVTPASTTTSLTTSLASSLYGQDVTLTATVAPGLNGVMASGTVTFDDGNTVLGTATLAGGVATFDINTLGLGTHALVAQYSGDGNLAGSISNGVTQTVHLAPNSIGGTVYSDATGNGSSADDAPLANVTVNLFQVINGTDSLLSSQLSGSNGQYSFSNLDVGTYFVQEVLPAGMVQTAGSSGYTLSATGGTNATGDNFDNYLPPPSGAISGYVFADDNLDGMFDTTTLAGSSVAESGLAGATITLTGSTLSGSAVNLSTTSNASGFYSFGSLAGGNYTVSLTGFSPNAQAEASRGSVPISYSTNVSLAAGQTLAGNAGAAASASNGLDFAEITTGSLAGAVWADTNNDGAISSNEVGIMSVTVELTGTTYTGTAVSQSIMTNNNGQFSFANLLPGTYSLTEVTPSGFTVGKNALGTLGGSVSKTAFSNVRIGGSGEAGTGYDFAESAASLASSPANTGNLNFWHNGRGQALLLGLNGGSSSKALGNWLAAMFPNLYGSHAKTNLAGMTNAQIASLYVTDFGAKGTKTDASVLAAAFSCYVTNSTWAGGNYAAQDGFTVTAQGVGYETVSVGANGSAFGVANNSGVSILQALAAANQQAVNGALYNGNSTLQSEAYVVFSSIAQYGLNN